MYVLDVVRTIILFMKGMYENKNKKFSWLGAFSVVRQGCSPTIYFYLALFGRGKVSK